MLRLGEMNQLAAVRMMPQGCYLADEEGNEVLLPNKYLPDAIDEGDVFDVFVYKDSGNRIVATTLRPRLLLHEIAVLEVKQESQNGVFMDWGLEKDLLIPFSERVREMPVGTWHPVFLYLDKVTQRLVGSCRIHRFLKITPIDAQPGDEVQIIPYESTPLGMKVVVNQQHTGMVYRNEMFRPLRIGDVTTGFIKTLREDGKIDILLQKTGMEAIVEGTDVLLEKLKAGKGFLAVTDKSDPKYVANLLNMSKKTFKKAAGALYKQKLIRLEEDGIYLV